MISGADISIDGTTSTLYTPTVEQEENLLALKWLCQAKAILPYNPGMSVPISAVYHYDGCYSGIEIGDISAYGTAVIS